jgi:hypothetical protein
MVITVLIGLPVVYSSVRDRGMAGVVRGVGAAGAGAVGGVTVAGVTVGATAGASTAATALLARTDSHTDRQVDSTERLVASTVEEPFVVAADSMVEADSTAEVVSMVAVATVEVVDAGNRP